MASITKKVFEKSLTADMRRSAERLYHQMRNALLTEEKANKRRASSETPRKQRNYASDMQIIDKLAPDFRGEVSYNILGRKRVSVVRPGELTRENGILRKTRKILKRNADTGDFYLGLYERKTWLSLSRHVYAADGSLRAKHVKYKHGRFEEKWERDENGVLIRTHYVNRKRLLQPVHETMSVPYRSGPENRLYREFTQQKGLQRHIFERDDKGNLELVGSKSIVSSKTRTKSDNHRTAQTKIRKLGGAFSRSYRSLLDNKGNELGRDPLSHRRLFNKRTAKYDETSGRLMATKHTFGKLYKSEISYDTPGLRKVTKSVLGVTIGRKLMALSQSEREAERLRALEVTTHSRLWEEGAAFAGSSLIKTEDLHLVST